MNWKRLFVAKSPKEHVPSYERRKNARKRNSAIKRMFIASQVKPGMSVIHVKGNYNTNQIFLNGKELDPKKVNKIMGWKDQNFDWGGYCEETVAVAILLECVSEELAKKYYEDFRWDVCRHFDRNFDKTINVAEFIDSKES